MTNALVPAGTAGHVIAAAGENPFAVTFAPAMETLDAARRLKQLRQFSDLPMLNIKQAERHRDEARERFEHIPEDALMYDARKLFIKAAQEEPAPEAWLHAAIGLTLDSIPSASALPRSYRFGLVDLMMDDEPGFSCAVVAVASRGEVFIRE